MDSFRPRLWWAAVALMGGTGTGITAALIAGNALPGLWEAARFTVAAVVGLAVVGATLTGMHSAWHAGARSVREDQSQGPREALNRITGLLADLQERFPHGWPPAPGGGKSDVVGRLVDLAERNGAGIVVTGDGVTITGSKGPTVAAGPAAVAIADEQPPAAGGDDQQRSAVYSGLAMVVLYKVDPDRVPGDDTAVRGLVKEVEELVPEASAGMVRDFVFDFVRAMKGLPLYPDRNWLLAFAGLPRDVWAAWLTSYVAAAGADGLTPQELLDRVGHFGGEGLLAPLVGELVGQRRLRTVAGRLVAPEYAGGERPTAVEDDDPRAGALVCRLVEALVGEMRPEDGNLAGRGISHLVEAVGPQVPDLAADVVRAFVNDYMWARAGQRPGSGLDWRSALSGLPPQVLEDWLVDYVAAAGAGGLTPEQLADRIGHFVVGDVLSPVPGGLVRQHRLRVRGDRLVAADVDRAAAG